jgi:hypothetical protein
MISSRGPRAATAPAVEDEEAVAGGNRRGPVGHDDDGAPVGLRRGDGGVQRLASFGVERRVRLVEDEEDRVAIERAGEREALLLAAREAAHRGAEAGVVAFGELEHDVVDMGLSPPRRPARGRGIQAMCAMFSATVPSKKRTSCGRSRCGSRARRGRTARASRRRAGPRPPTGGAGPVMTRARVDLPEPLRPMTPSASPGFEGEGDGWRTGGSPGHGRRR